MMISCEAQQTLLERAEPLASFNDDTILAMDGRPDRLYVIKQVPAPCAALYRAVAAISHPNLAPIAGVAEQGTAARVIRPYISGQTLAERMRGTPVSPDEALRIAADVCAGLAALHRAGIVHRDVTPGNILITDDGFAKLIDYGIARSFTAAKPADTEILGTPGYAAPEQFGFSQSSAQTDIYAVGVLLNVMCTGAFPNERLADGKLGRIVRKCTAMDAKRRYQTAEQLGNALQSLRRTLRPAGDAATPPFLRRIPGLRSRWNAVAALALLGYLVLIAFSAAFLSGIPAEPLRAVGMVTSWVLMVPAPFCCFTNFLNVWDRLPISRGMPQPQQRRLYILLGVCSIFLSLLLLGLSVPPSTPAAV